MACLLAFSVSAADKKVSDDELFDQVRRKLTNDPDVRGGTLDVDVKDGVVTLRGAVDKEKSREKAEKLTKKVKGVKGVVNELKVAPLVAR
jgi:osmotically-inducible protein OsmY